MLWSSAEGKVLWALLAASSGVFAIVHASLGVPARLADWGEVKRHFAVLQSDLGSLRYEMRINPDFLVEDVMTRFLALRQRYSEGVLLIKHDVLLTDRLKGTVQDSLNEQLKEDLAET